MNWQVAQVSVYDEPLGQHIEPIGQIDAAVCSDGSCEGFARVGLVDVVCTHPEHQRRRRLEQWEEYQERIAEPNFSGLDAILHSAGPLTYSITPRVGKFYGSDR